jgi:hypothetical protein
MVNLNEDLMRKTVFVRYNPDAYKTSGRKQNPNWSTRTDLLRKWLLRAFEFREDMATMEIVRLYFDDFKVETTTFTGVR